jgi:hypothetical protein
VEIRLSANAAQPLATKVFFSDEEAFEVASVIVMGKTEAVLIDAQWTLSAVHRLIAEILETGKKLRSVYLTHAHPDHYFGAGFFRLPGKGRYHIVRFVALFLNGCNVERADSVPRQGHLAAQLFIHLLPLSLVVRVFLMAECGCGVVETDGDIAGVAVTQYLDQDPQEAVDRVDHLSPGRCQGRKGVIRPVHEGITVNKVQGFHWL